jgi:hypothetical protein
LLRLPHRGRRAGTRRWNSASPRKPNE